MKREKNILIIYSVFVALGSIYLHFSYLFSTILFFFVPSLYITVKRPGLLRPLGIYSLMIAIPFVIIIDVIGLYNNAWWETSIFSVRVFGLTPFDTVLWAILYSYTILALYEYFFGGKLTISLPKKFWRFTTVLLALFITFCILFALHPEWFVVPYFYALFVGIFYIFVSIVGLLRSYKTFSYLWVQCLFFSILLLIQELGALASNHWGFSGNEYLGMIHLGQIMFPFEEMIWILTGVPAFIYVYLSLTDQLKNYQGSEN